jgi:acyl dehydratase
MSHINIVQGKYFEDLEMGAVFRHAVRRTVTETDNLLFTVMTMNTQPLHLDEEFSKNSVAGTRLCNSIFTLGLVIGVGVSEVSGGTTVANLGFTEIVFPKPVLIGDTLHAETEVMEKRPSESRKNAGVVYFEHRGYNQRDELIAKIRRTALMLRRPAASP